MDHADRAGSARNGVIVLQPIRNRDKMIPCLLVR
jgi:hypothetical protein